MFEALRMKLLPNPTWEELCVHWSLFMAGLEDMGHDVQGLLSSRGDAD